MKHPKIHPRVRKAIERIIDYSWTDELKHFINCGVETRLEDRGDPGHHIFNDLVVIDNFINDKDKTPRFYVKQELNK